MLHRAKETGRRAGLINVSSTLAFQPVPFLATYAASKMFIFMYTQALAAELRSKPIDVLTLGAPGPRAPPSANGPAFRSAVFPARFRLRRLPAKVWMRSAAVLFM
jgi:short-subunit dehydrogenase